MLPKDRLTLGDDERHFSKANLARYLDASVRWVNYQLAGPDPPPGYKIAGRWIFRKSEVDRWLEKFTTTADLDTMLDDVIKDLQAK